MCASFNGDFWYLLLLLVIVLVDFNYIQDSLWSLIARKAYNKLRFRFDLLLIVPLSLHFIVVAFLLLFRLFSFSILKFIRSSFRSYLLHLPFFRPPLHHSSSSSSSIFGLSSSFLFFSIFVAFVFFCYLCLIIFYFIFILLVCV